MVIDLKVKASNTELNLRRPTWETHTLDAISKYKILYSVSQR